MTYTSTQYSIFAGKSCIGTMLADNRFVILQGMNREQTIKKVLEDCPEFALRYNLTEYYHPKLRSQEFFNQIKD